MEMFDKALDLYTKVLECQLKLIKKQLVNKTAVTLLDELEETKKIKNERNLYLEELNSMGMYVNFNSLELVLK